MFMKQLVQAQNFATETAQVAGDKVRQEEGEIASQIIVMAMLVGVAAIVVTAGPQLTTLANSIVTNVN